MARYFFHLVDDADMICDPEGSELPDIKSAREQALLSAREIVAEAIKTGAQKVPRFIVAVSDGGNEVAVVDVKDVVPTILKRHCLKRDMTRAIAP